MLVIICTMHAFVKNHETQLTIECGFCGILQLNFSTTNIAPPGTELYVTEKHLLHNKHIEKQVEVHDPFQEYT